jgi:hypothetical protein
MRKWRTFHVNDLTLICIPECFSGFWGSGVCISAPFAERGKPTACATLLALVSKGAEEKRAKKNGHFPRAVEARN